MTLIKSQLSELRSLNGFITSFPAPFASHFFINLQQVTALGAFSKTSNIDYISQTIKALAALENVTEYDNIRLSTQYLTHNKPDK